MRGEDAQIAKGDYEQTEWEEQRRDLLPLNTDAS